MKAIILARVSTKEQEEGHSIAAQRQRLDDYCARKGLDVIRTFELIESSTRGERKEFVAMLEFAKAQKETIAIVADAVDRFQRSFKESVQVDALRQQDVVELHFYREGMVINRDATSSDILRWDFSVMSAKSYVLNLSDNVKRSLEYKRRNGEWGGKAPLGYKNVRDHENKSVLIHDKERAFLVRMLFEEYATGTASISGDLVRKAKAWGLVNKTKKGGFLSASQIQHILLNPFYYGEMRIKGKLYRHKYEPLISRELFDRCGVIMRCSGRATAMHYSEKEFVFRGLIKCGVSGRMVTSDLKKGKYTYLVCRDPADPSRKMFVPEGEVIAQVKAALRSIRIPDALLGALLSHMKAGHAAENRFHIDAIVQLREEQDRVRDRLSTLLDMRIDKSITQTQYDEKARALKQQQIEIAARIEQHQTGDNAFKTTLETLISVASRAAEIFDGSKPEQKRKLVALVFSNLKLNGKTLEYSTRSPFDLMVNLCKLVGGLGFEPRQAESESAVLPLDDPPTVAAPLSQYPHPFKTGARSASGFLYCTRINKPATARKCRTIARRKSAREGGGEANPRAMARQYSRPLIWAPTIAAC
jgi:site-specific DNA recombinase